MGVSVGSGQIGVDALVIRSRWVAQIYFSEVALEAFPSDLQFRLFEDMSGSLDLTEQASGALESGGEPARGRRPATPRMPLDRRVDFVIEL